MKPTPSPFAVSFQVESFRKGKRHHWMICLAENPEELVSWGHEVTRELAEAAAEKELQCLSIKATQGGRVTTTNKPFTRHTV